MHHIYLYFKYKNEKTRLLSDPSTMANHSLTPNKMTVYGATFSPREVDPSMPVEVAENLYKITPVAMQQKTSWTAEAMFGFSVTPDPTKTDAAIALITDRYSMIVTGRSAATRPLVEICELSPRFIVMAFAQMSHGFKYGEPIHLLICPRSEIHALIDQHFPKHISV